MPIDRGTVTCARYFVVPEGKDKERRALANGLRRGAFEPLDRDGDLDRSAGWVEIENHDSTELPPNSFVLGEHLLLCWRIDTLRVPTAQAKAELDAWAKSFQDKQKRPPSKKERLEEKELIIRKLRKRAFISSKTFDVSVNLQNDVVLIWASSRKVVEEIVIALEESVGLTMTSTSPGALAERAGVPEASLAPTVALFGEDVARETKRHAG
jgi:recombination associated protein RdgC